MSFGGPPFTSYEAMCAWVDEEYGPGPEIQLIHYEKEPPLEPFSRSANQVLVNNPNFDCASVAKTPSRRSSVESIRQLEQWIDQGVINEPQLPNAQALVADLKAGKAPAPYYQGGLRLEDSSKLDRLKAWWPGACTTLPTFLKFTKHFGKCEIDI